MDLKMSEEDIRKYAKIIRDLFVNNRNKFLLTKEQKHIIELRDEWEEASKYSTRRVSGRVDEYWCF